MNPTDVLRLVDDVHRERDLPKDIVFKILEDALLYAARKHFGDDKTELAIEIDRKTGQIRARHGDQEISPEVLGRIAAQTAKQVVMQRIREAEAEEIYRRYANQTGHLVHGMVTRREELGRGRGGYVVNLGRVEAYLPAARIIPGEELRVGDRIKAVIEEVRKEGGRVRILLSRSSNELVKRLFEQEIPEVADHTIEIKAIARRPGIRCKVAVTSNDARVEPTGACIGVRGARIKNITEQLGGEHIDVVRWHPAPEVFVKEALQPAKVEEVLLFQQLHRAAALVRQDQLSKAIGMSGHNVRLASMLTNWDIEIMTHDELSTTLAKAEESLQQIPNLSPEQVARMIEDGFWSFSDLSCAEPAYLAQLLGISREQAEEVIAFAEKMSAHEEEHEYKHLGEAVRRGAVTVSEDRTSHVVATPAAPEQVPPAGAMPTQPAAADDQAAAVETARPSREALTSPNPEADTLAESPAVVRVTGASDSEGEATAAHHSPVPDTSAPASTPVS
ncbi:MAG: transcription termination factor NusA [Gemmatales bacterium]|nr:transcription termination factor NusA [Gemmatales bacterium]MDW8175319.1 transcription termination factor NusA [Gemmatales bacterium]